ncbi:hypothetical protein M413DRAFT_167868 [Hebeloma cylindrosporum]|uniref:Zn(2)-C6 fungal-type domain-containing protein n=1 Tax=Hebeloma cylindrosporum TaxID=76867 RepID=A0A0C2XSV2_HEBCY|nr:hypothetical protein M413DRAFT_167868 [Hebeloma cylindrosporum h7]
MSSNEDECNDGETSLGLSQKKRRMQRACDVCRKKKIRCDGVQTLGNPCSNCVSSRFDCTYVEEAKKRSPPKGYIESLESRVEKLDKLERLLRRLCPDQAVYNQLYASLDSNQSTIERPPIDPSTLVGGIASKSQPNASTIEKVTSAIQGAMEDKSDSPRSDVDNPGEEDPTLILADNLKRMALTSSDQFFGKSSGAMLIRSAFELRKEYMENEPRFNDPLKPALKSVRPEFWGSKPWECKFDVTAPPKYKFPDLDLARHCIDLYFLHSNLYLPLLHRPTFEKSVEEGLHLQNDNFAPVFLLVCAVGARYSDDPRVRLDGVDSIHSAGWKWFEQVQIMKLTMLALPTLYDLQLHCLGILYLQSASAPQCCWTLAGAGIRLAQDIGVHRRKVHDHTLTTDAELWKRAFWVLVCYDRIFSSSLGRSCAIQDEDFDLDLPVDCDDEYWEHPDPEKCFKQPPNKPSSVTSFILYIKLHQVHAFALRTIYSINQSKILLGFVGQHWEQHVVTELDSALNKWVDSVPDHLRWDPNREDPVFFNQSVLLYATYYHIQIIIHRPFIPSPSKPSPLSFPSLAICTNAARSCSHIIDIHRKRRIVPLTVTQMPIFTSGIVLLLSVWGGKRSGLLLDPNKEMADVHKCMKALKASEDRLGTSGRLWDVLNELASVGELPLPQTSPSPGTKRDRGSDHPLSTTAGNLSSTLVSQNETPRVIVGSRRVGTQPSFTNQTQRMQTHLPPHQQSPAAPPPSGTSISHMVPPPSQHTPSDPTMSNYTNADPPLFSLPVYGSELGRLPLHGQLNFSSQAHLSHPQTHTPLQDSHTNYRYNVPSDTVAHGDERSEPTFYVGSNQVNSPYWLQYAPALPQQQQQQHAPSHHHASLGSSVGGFSSTSGMNSTTQGQVAHNTFDSTTGTTTYTPQRTSAGTSAYSSEPMGLSIPSSEPSSIVPALPQSGTNSSMEKMDGGMGLVSTPDHSVGHYHWQYRHQHQGVTPQQGQQSFPFTVDNDTVEILSNVPTGLNDWSTFLTNFGESAHGHIQDYSGGLYQHPHPPQQGVPRQHEQQPFSYPLNGDIGSNVPTGFESDNGVQTLRTSFN